MSNSYYGRQLAKEILADLDNNVRRRREGKDMSIVGTSAQEMLDDVVSKIEARMAETPSSDQYLTDLQANVAERRENPTAETRLDEMQANIDRRRNYS